MPFSILLLLFGLAQSKCVDPKYSSFIVYLHLETKDISYTQTIPFLLT